MDDTPFLSTGPLLVACCAIAIAVALVLLFGKTVVSRLELCRLGSLPHFRQVGHVRFLEALRALSEHDSGDLIHLGNRPVVKELLLNTRMSVFARDRPQFKTFHTLYSAGIPSLGTMPFDRNTVALRKVFKTQLTQEKLKHDNHRNMFEWWFLDHLRSKLVELSGPDGVFEPARLLHVFANGLIIEIMTGTRPHEDRAGLIAVNELRVFQLRSLGEPFSDYDTLQELRAAMVSFLDRGRRYVTGILGRSGETATHSSRDGADYKRIQTEYISQLVKEMEELEEDAGPAILRDGVKQVARSHPDLNAIHERILANTFASIGCLVGTMLQWLLLKLATDEGLQATIFEELMAATPVGQIPDIYPDHPIPFLVSVHKECSRVFPTPPMGFLRAISEDVVFRNQQLRARTIVAPNVYGINRDPSVYNAPDEFRPDRFVDASVQQPFTFGLGDRSCVGMSYAQSIAYAFLVTVVYAFHIEKVPLTNEAKQDLFDPDRFKAGREASSAPDFLEDGATPNDGQVRPLPYGIRLSLRDIFHGSS